MFAEQRHEMILRAVREKGSVRLAFLAERLGVSTVTLRRDVELLAERGLVNRVHGGVTMAGAVPAPELATAAEPVLTLGMLVPSATYYYPAVINGARAQAERLGARVVLGVSRYHTDEDAERVAQLVNGGVAGLLLTLSRQPDTAHERLLAGLTVPAVLVERQAELGGVGSLLDSVASHHAHGAFLGARHLAELGHRKLALASRSSPTAPSVRRGFLAVVHEYGLDEPVHLDVDFEGPFTEQVRHVIAAIEDGVTGLLAHNDADALLLAQHLAAAGVRVPADVSLVAYDDEVASLSDPPLTAVAPPKEAVGRHAVDLLVRRIKAEPDIPAQHVALLPGLRVRQSTAPPR
ncbi:substrate-binding domain-containing protein [Nonomuraea sp. NPDC004297]